MFSWKRKEIYLYDSPLMYLVFSSAQLFPSGEFVAIVICRGYNNPRGCNSLPGYNNRLSGACEVPFRFILFRFNEIGTKI